MSVVTIHEAKTHLSRLLRRVSGGEEIIIARGKEPVAKLVPLVPTKPRLLGQDRGKVVISDDFDAPLPEDLLKAFEE